MIKRKIEAELLVWKDSEHRKPLILRGARQVGKTTLINQFSNQFEHYIYLNLERNDHLEIFGDDLDVHDLYQLICLRSKIPMSLGNTLLFIDEIQNSPRAIKMLRFFYEVLPQLHLIAAGSLLEAVISDVQVSFPVGRVEYMWLYPLDFEEFLDGCKSYDLIAEMQVIPVSRPVLIELRKIYKTYALIGGMPEIVTRYLQEPDLVKINPLYRNLLQAYSDDIEKYAPRTSVAFAMRHILENGFASAGKRIKLEGFGNSNYKSAIMKEAFSLLERALLLKLQYPTTSAVVPLVPNLRRSPRLQVLDTGLINYRLGLQEEYYTQPDLESVYRGMIIQHLVGQELQCLEHKLRGEITYWVRDKRQSSAEVDFVLPYKGMLVPIEVKSGKSGSLKSLHQFMSQAGHDIAVRIYEGDLSIEEVNIAGGPSYRLLNLPLPLTCKILPYLDWMMEQAQAYPISH